MDVNAGGLEESVAPSYQTGKATDPAAGSTGGKQETLGVTTKILKAKEAMEVESKAGNKAETAKAAWRAKEDGRRNQAAKDKLNMLVPHEKTKAQKDMGGESSNRGLREKLLPSSTPAQNRSRDKLGIPSLLAALYVALTWNSRLVVKYAIRLTLRASQLRSVD